MDLMQIALQLSGENDTKEAEITALNERIQHYQTHVRQLAKTISDARIDNTLRPRLQEENNKLKELNEGLVNQLRQAEAEKNAADSKLEASKRGLVMIRKERDEAFEKNDNLMKRFDKLQKEKVKAKASLNSLESELSITKSAKDQLEQINRELESDLKESDELNIKTQKKYNELYEKYNELYDISAKFKEKKDELERSKLELINNLKTVTQQKEADDARVLQLETEVTKLNVENGRLVTGNRELENKLQAIKEEMKTAADKSEKDAEEKQLLKDAAETKAADLAEKIASMQLQNGRLMTGNRELENKLQVIRDEMKSAVDKSSKEIEDVKLLKDAAETKVADLADNLASIQLQNGRLMTGNRELENKLQTIREEMKTAVHNSAKEIEEMKLLKDAAEAKVSELAQNVASIQLKFETAEATITELDAKLAASEIQKEEAEKRATEAESLRAGMSIGMHKQFLCNNFDLDTWKATADQSNQALYDKLYMKNLPPLTAPDGNEVETQQRASTDEQELSTLPFPVARQQPVGLTALRGKVHHQSSPLHPEQTQQIPGANIILLEHMQRIEEAFAQFQAQFKPVLSVPIQQGGEPPSKRLRLEPATDEADSDSVSPFLPDDADMLNALPTCSRYLEAASSSHFQEEENVNLLAEHSTSGETSAEGECIDEGEATCSHHLELLEATLKPLDEPIIPEESSGDGAVENSISEETEASAERRHDPAHAVSIVLEEAKRLVAVENPSMQALEKQIIDCFAAFEQNLTLDQLKSINRTDFAGRVFWLTNAARKNTSPKVLTDLMMKLFDAHEEQRNRLSLPQPSPISSMHGSALSIDSSTTHSEIESDHTSACGLSVGGREGNDEQLEPNEWKKREQEKTAKEKKRDEGKRATSSKNSPKIARRESRILKKRSSFISAEKRKRSLAPIPVDDSADPLLVSTRPKRLALYRSGEVFNRCPLLQKDTNIMIADFAAVVGKTMEEVYECNNAVWDSLQKVKDRLTEGELHECNAMASSEDDPDLCKLLHLCVFLNGKKQKNGEEVGLDRVRRVFCKVRAPTPEAAILKLIEQEMFQPLVLKCVPYLPMYYLYIDRKAVLVDGGLRKAMLSVVAATRLFDAVFDEQVEDVVSFFYDAAENNDAGALEKLLARE